jgi:UDP-3-O-[3-hydroxymyristoyl] glucosamine N-acyltransferase
MKLKDMAELVSGTLIGDGEINIQHLAPIEAVNKGALVFADGEDKLKIALESPAAAILANKVNQATSKPIIQVANPLKAFITLINHFYPRKQQEVKIHPSANIARDVTLGNDIHIGANVVIEEGVSIGDNTELMANTYVGHDVTIGKGCKIFPQVTIYHDSQIGNQVIIHASSVIGSDGFGYTFSDGEHIKIPHAGNVVIEDNVEIGANTVIDRATLGSTHIGQGTKIDNLVQIAHSVSLGKNNILCAFTGIAGSTRSGDNVIFAANVGVSDHVKIDDDVILGARTGVPPKKHLTQGNIYLGNPARPKDKALATEVATARLPLMRKNLKTLQQRVKDLEDKLVTQNA